MQEMVQFVYDFYQSKLKTWQNMKSDKLSKEERLKKLNEEEKIIREKLNQAIERSENKYGTRLDIGRSFDGYGSSSSSSEEESEHETNSKNDFKNEDLKESMYKNKVQE
jgi:hypothetical protein